MSDIRKFKCVVPVSGGKDSQVCLELALEKFEKEDIIGLFCDTQFEHEITYAHVDFMEKHYGVKIERISEGSVEEKCLKYGRFPGGGARHCTDELKIQPTKKFLKALAEKQGSGFEVWYGMRFEESNERAKRYESKIHEDLYPPHEIMSKYPKYLAKMGVMFRLPILEWSFQEVIAHLDGKENPLYKAGFKRVGCFPCQAAGDAHKEKAYAFDDFGREQYIKIKNVADIIEKPMFTSKGGAQRNNEDQIRLFDSSPGCAVCSI
jgi:3'-phosphoadenosine 5'-phosphosulfate sulfotransferase (PAPS reductase)/FAD synthetase